MKRMAAGLAAGAVWLAAAMPAFAQQASVDDLTDDQRGELYCVYDYLTFFADSTALVDAYMSGDPESAAYKEQMAELDGATAYCNDEYPWPDDRKDTASMIGLYAVIGDEVELRMRNAGLKEQDLEAFYDTVDAMTDDDIGAFVDGVWAGKDDVAHRFIAALAAKGIKGAAVDKNAIYLAEAYILVSLLTGEWLQGAPAAS